MDRIHDTELKDPSCIGAKRHLDAGANGLGKVATLGFSQARIMRKEVGGLSSRVNFI